ncbi:LacI family DNA-binding transcriptional regulator [Rubrivirga sp.]|uniref:LacI family DNA-binding transcriptional regulator n=1 Tax=Rubrivirga sp. TaxID=1885344 RepID=UPI003B51AB08
MPVTIYDIAEGASVSIATVSRAFNGHPRVSETTRQRVFEVAQSLGYEPHASAQSLARQNTNLVSAVVPIMTSAFFMEVLRGIQDRLDASSYDLVVYASRTLDSIGGQLARAVQPGRADGLLLISTPLADDRARQIRDSGRPAVLVDAHHPEIDSVTVDNRRGGAIATRHLLARGHGRIGLVLPVAGSGPSDRREAGYRDALAEAGVEADPDLVVHAEWDLVHHGYTRYAGYRAMRALLQRFEGRDDGPTAVFVAADVMAFGALRAVREAGLRTPRDLDVVGFDDIEPSAYAGLTTVRQPMYEMGQLATEHLLRRLDAPGAPPAHTVFAPDLVLRETTGEAVRELA